MNEDLKNIENKIKKIKIDDVEKILEDEEIKKTLDNLFKGKKIVVTSEIAKMTNNANVILVIETYLHNNDIELMDDGLNQGTLSTQINDYLRSIKEYNIFTKEEEKEIFEEYTKTKDIKIRNYIMEHNLRLVAGIASHYKIPGMDIMDLIQYGNIGLETAVERFDVTKGFKFSTYATWWINQAILRETNDTRELIRKPVHLNETISKLQKFQKEYQMTHAKELKYTEENIEKLAKEFKTTKETIQEAIKAISTTTSSLDVAIGEKEDSTISELIEDENVHVEDGIVNDIIKSTIDEALENSKLTEREIDIIKRRYGFDNYNEQTLEEIGKHYNLTRERIRQILEKALKKLKRNKIFKHLGTAVFNEDEEVLRKRKVITK